MPRGQDYKKRRTMVAMYFAAIFPTLTVDEMARLEGLSVWTVRKVASEMNIDLKLYNRRRKLVKQYNDVDEQIRKLRQQIHTPITKKEQ